MLKAVKKELDDSEFDEIINFHSTCLNLLEMTLKKLTSSHNQKYSLSNFQNSGDVHFRVIYLNYHLI